MKLKQFIFALVAMLLSFVSPAFAQVAKVGNTEYATIDEAIAKWTDGTTLTLLADVTLSDVVMLKSTEHHTLELGTYTMTAASGKNAIEITCEGRSSASYAQNFATDNLAAGYELNADGTVAAKPVASINGTKYTSLSEAVAAAQAGDEIVMHADATVEGTLALPAGIKLTSNGHTITGSIRMLGNLELNGPLTITGGLWVGKSGETLTATLSGDKLTANYFMFQYGTYTINADIDAVYGYLSYEGTFEVNSTIHTTGANGEVLYINGNVTLNDGAVLDSDNSVFVCNDNAVLTLKPGSKVDSNVNITKSRAKLNIDATGMAAGASANITGTVTNSGNGTIAVVGNDKLEASIVGGKIVLAAKPVAKIGTTAYATLDEALEATKTMTGDVTVEILDKVTFNQPLIGNYSSINFVGKAENAEMYLDVQGYTTATGKKVTFTDLKLSKSEGGFIANAGFMNVAFGIYDVKKVSYNNCTFLNGACASSGEVTFNGCTFYRSHDRYGLWAYGAPSVTVDGCTFADIRGIKLWDEGKQKLGALTVKNTDFSAVTDKPAIVLTSGKSVVLAGNTYNADKGTFELDLDGNPNGTPVTSDVAPVCVNDNGACGVLVDGKIYTTVAQAAEVATSGSTVTLLHNSAETVALPMGVTLNKNNFEAAGVTVAVPVAKIGDVEYATLAAAVEAAQAGAEIVVVANVADVTIDITKNLTISGDATLNNVGINANGADVLTVKGLTFTGNSWINSGTAEALTVSGITATVAPSNTSYTNSRSAFISLGRSEGQELALTVENSNITVTAAGADAILGWAKITAATITGNVIKGSNDGYFTNADAIKFMSIANGAEFVVNNNEIYSNYNGIVFAQNTTRDNAYSVSADANKFYGGADHIWIEISGGNTVHATFNATSANTVNGNAFTVADIKYHDAVIKNWTSYAGVDVVTDANGKVIGGTLAAFSNAESVAEGYEIGTNGAVGKASVAEVNGVKYASFAEAAAAAQADSEIKLLADIEGDITVPANVTLNGNGFAISGGILAEGDITFAGVTTAADFDANVVNTAVNIPAGASLQLTGSARLVIGHGATFNITGTIEDAKTADKATLVPSLKIAAGASITGNGVTFNVNNAYIVANANTTSKNSNANGTLDFNINNSIWEQTGVLAFYVPTSGKDPVVNFELKNSVLTTTSHLVFSVTKGEVVIDNSNVNVGKSNQIENRSTMTIKNGSVVNGAVATSSNAINPGTIIVENATYAVTGEFSGAAEGTGTLIIKKDANVSVGSIKAGANVTVDAEGMAAGDEINFTANLSQFTGTLSVINNDKLEASIVDGKVVLAAKPVAKIGEQGYATLQAAVDAAVLMSGDVTIEVMAGTYAENINLTNTAVTVGDANARPNITFKPAAGADVTLAGTTTLGYRVQNVGASMWQGEVIFEGIKFNHAENGKHSLDIQDVKGITLLNCTITGDGEYGIGSNGSNATPKAAFTNCTFENGAMQVLGQLSANLVIDGCIFDEFSVNAQGGAKPGLTIKNSTFNLTLTDAHVGESFYAVRSNANPINIQNTKVTVDSELSSVAADQAKWGLFWARKDGKDVQWNVASCEVNLTDAAMAQTELPLTKNDGTANAFQRIILTDLTSTSNNVADLIKRTEGCATVNGINYKDGERDLTGLVAKIGDEYYATLAEALADAKTKNLSDVVITIIGENTAATADNFALYDETVFNNVTFLQDNGGKTFYINELYTGSRNENGQFVFDGVNIVITGQYINQCKTVLKNNSMVKRSNDTKNFIMGDMVIEPGSKYDGQIDAIYAGSITVDGGKTDGTYNTEFDFKTIFFESYYPLVVKNGAYVIINAANEIGTWTLKRGVSQIQASKVEVFNTITLEASATLALDAKSVVYAKAVNGAGKITIDATGMVAGDVVNLNADFANFTGTLSVINNDKLDAQIVDGKVVLVAKPVAKIGEQGYNTLEEAFKAATSGCTIDILSDVTVDYAWDARKTGAKFTVPVTINGNGKTIKFTASVNDNNYQAPFRFEADATVKNLTIDMSEVTDNRFRAISSKGNLTVDNSKFIGKDETLNCRAIIFGEGAGTNVGNLAISITNSEFINWKRGITDNENAQDVKTVTIKGNTMTDAGVGVSAKETVTFTGNTVAGAYVNIKSYTANNKLAVTATGNTLEANTDESGKFNVIDAGGVVNAEGFKVVAKGNNFNGYTGTDGIWGEVWGNARESFVIKVLDANDNVMGTTSLNNVGGIIDGDVNVSWNLKFNAAANTDEYWTMEWTTAPTLNNMPAKVELWVDGTRVSGGPVVLNGPDDLNKINVIVTDADGKITSCQTTVANALTAAKNGETVNLLWKDGQAPLAMNGAVFGKNVTITGTAKVDWNKGFLFVGRGGEGNATVTFDGANLTSASNSSSYGIHVSGREKNTTNKYDGTLVIKNSTIELDFLINKGAMTLDNATLTVKNGTAIGGRPASETESGADATATVELKNGSKLVVNNHNGMGLGYEAIGVMNIDATSTFETTQSFLVTAKGTMNIAGKATIAGTLTNNGSIVLTTAGAELTSTECGNVTTNVSNKIVSYNEGKYTLGAAVAKIGDTYYATLEDALAAEGNVVELLATYEVAAGETKTLDLMGKTINVAYAEGSTTNHIYAIDNKGTLKITGNGTINARGIFNYGAMTLENGTINAIDGNGGYGVRNYAGATFTMNGGTIATTLEDDHQVNNGGYDATTVRVDEGATFTMNGGELNNICDYTFAIDNYGKVTVNGGTVTSVHSTVSNYGTVTINGGSFTCNGLEGVTAHVIVAWDGSTTTINGGTFDGKDNYNGFNVDASKGANVVIKGGKFLSVHSGSLYGDGTITVSGGTFFDKISDQRCELGFQAVDNTEGAYDVIRTDIRETYTIEDGKMTEFVNETPIEVGTLTYKRTLLDNTKWSPLFVPFAIPLSELSEKYEVAYINDVHAWDNWIGSKENGIKGEDGEIDDMDMEVIKIKNGTLKPNHPYVIRPKDNVDRDLTLVLYNTELCSTAMENRTIITCSSAYTRFEVNGTYVAMSKSDLDGRLIISTSGGWTQLKETSTLMPFRLHLTVTDHLGSPVDVSSESEIRIRVVGEKDEVTGIFTPYISVTTAKEGIFDLMGRPVVTPEKGKIYIVDGKKMMWK